MPTARTIWLHPGAPAKPPPGEPCNGCGVCCADRPCPLGMLASRRLDGRCAALRWSPAAQAYRCALLGSGTGWLTRPTRALVARWIGAGKGCDSMVEVTAGDAAAAR